MFLLPLLNWPRINSRNCVHPSPKVILPLTSTTATESTCRIVAFMLTVGSSLFSLNSGTQAFDHGHFCPRTVDMFNPEFVHEAADEKYSAPGHVQQVFIFQRIGDALWIEAVSLVPDAYFQPVAMNFKLQPNALAGIILIAVPDGINHRLVHGHFNALLFVLIESCGACHAACNLLRHLNILEVTFQCHLNATAFWNHRVRERTQVPYLKLPQGCGKVNARVDFLPTLEASISMAIWVRRVGWRFRRLPDPSGSPAGRRSVTR